MLCGPFINFQHPMIAHHKPNWIDWGFVVFLALVCTVLAALQYRWTGEIARAELTRLRTSLSEQSRFLCHAFDAELAESCTQLRPSREEIAELGRDAAYALRHRDWLAGRPRPIFHRIAVGITAAENIQLFALEKESQRLAPMELPEEWAALKEHCTRDRTPGGIYWPYANPGGTLIEFYSSRHRGGSSDNERLFFELDLDYARDVWLPELVRAYLNPDGRTPIDVEIKTVMSPVLAIYSSGTSVSDGGEKPVSIRLNRQGRSPDKLSGPGSEGRWTLEARHTPGTLEAMVSSSRQRNLGVAVALNALILAAGVALVRHTRRSRELAEKQMQFVANVSHELRTPLTVIRGAAHNLQRGVVQDPGRIAQYSGLIIQHAERLGEMVEQVLALAGAQNGSALTRRPVSLIDVINTAVAATAEETQSAGCEVEWNAPASLPAITGDAAALQRVIQNLIINAAKHGGEGRWIGISAAGGAEAITIEVRDHGPGVPEAEQAAIFDPFVRGGRAQSGQVRGSGLGLSLVREIVAAHAGSVSMRNDGGAVFTIRFPIA